MMLKKHKILVLTIILSLLGMLGIISTWLYGNYVNRREIVVAEVERSLFNSIQVYYDKNEDSIRENRTSQFNKDGEVFAQKIKRIYSRADTVLVKNLWDSLAKERLSRVGNRHRNYRNKNDSSAIIPSFMLQNINFNESTLLSIDSLLEVSLRDKSMFFETKVVLDTFEDRKSSRPKSAVIFDDSGSIITRPILVNPSNNQFLLARFHQPVLYLISHMAFQIIISLLLIAALMGTFVYLLKTISRQNRLAVLRKSFVNNMTHELKTPVATVMAAVEAVQRYGAKEDKVKMDKYLDISQRELQHLAGMIEKVLQLDIDEVNGIILQVEKVNLADIIEESIEVVKLGAKKAVNITLNIQSKTTMMVADASHMKNVINNLLDNAVKYSHDPVNISIQLTDNSESMILKIEDDGLGIESVYVNNIFDMFFRVPNGDLHTVKGFGLGLAYVKLVVQQHQGHIKVESIKGKGTVFTINLPKE